MCPRPRQSLPPTFLERKKFMVRGNIEAIYKLPSSQSRQTGGTIGEQEEAEEVKKRARGGGWGGMGSETRGSGEGTDGLRARQIKEEIVTVSVEVKPDFEKL